VAERGSPSGVAGLPNFQNFQKGDEMRLKVLGCSGGNQPGTNSPSFLLNKGILLDAGSVTTTLDIKSQLEITHVFITHPHLDHIKDLPLLIDNLIVSGSYPLTLKVLSIPEVIIAIKENIFNGLIWPDFTVIPSPEKPILKFVPLSPGEEIKIYEYSITPVLVEHTCPAVGYLVKNSAGRSLFYTGDTGPTNLTWEILEKVPLDALIIDLSFPNALSNLAEESGHLSPNLLVEELKKIKNPPKRIYPYHLKPHYQDKIIEELRELAIPGLNILRDGDIIELD
jgi:ribonuclease BN (tRNA processing enzyme)